MGDVIADFLADLERADDEPVLRRATGTLRFELEHAHATQRWLVTMDRGRVSVSRANAAANCVVRGDRTTLERVITGQLNPLASLLRGRLRADIDASSEVLVLFARYVSARVYRLQQAGLLPGPDRAAGSRPKGRRR